MSRGTVDLFHPKVVRATMSAIFRMPFYVSGDLCAELQILRQSGSAVMLPILAAKEHTMHRR